MSKEETTTGIGRRPYTKPKLEEVKLVMEEAVLASCKAFTVIGPQDSGGTCGAGWGHCKNAGS